MSAGFSQVKPLALDLCCGLGGWTNGLLAEGWDVVGVDIKDMGGYEGKLLLADVKTLTLEALMFFQLQAFGTVRPFSLVVASPPCQDFSYSSLPFKKARAKFSKENPPSAELWVACERIGAETGAPFVLENVRGARKWVRREDWHRGSFYFWGDCPPLLPSGSPRKGFGGGKNWKDRPMQDGRRSLKKAQFAGEYERENGLKSRVGPFAKESEKVRGAGGSTLREQWSAKVAMIPIELSTWIARYYFPCPAPDSRK